MMCEISENTYVPVLLPVADVDEVAACVMLNMDDWASIVLRSLGSLTKLTW